MNFYEKIDMNENVVKYILRAKYNEELTDEEIGRASCRERV